MTIKVENHAFHTAVADIDRTADRLRDARIRVGREVDGLLDDGWSGLAADAFTEGWEDWRHASQDVLDALTSLGHLVEAVHRDLVTQDVGSQDQLDQVAQRILTRLDR